jgi:glycine/D-amino acid oxidase-like deaminating enzyme
MALPAVTRAGYFQVATRPLPQDMLKRILPGGEGCWDTATVMSSFRLDRHGRLLVGAAGSLSHAGTSIHTNWAYRKMVALFPFLRNETIAFAWYGAIGMTGDHLPKIVRLGENALAVFGYSGRGIAPGTVFGKGLARHMLGNDPDALPVEPVEGRSERFTALRGAYYETGCVAAHLVADRLG